MTGTSCPKGRSVNKSNKSTWMGIARTHDKRKLNVEAILSNQAMKVRIDNKAKTKFK